MRKRHSASIVGALGLVAGGADAHPHSQEVPDVVVVANRLETSEERIGSSYSRLDPDDLHEAGRWALDEALRLVPGTGLGSEGGQRGSISALRMRGSESDHTLVLIDGMRVSDANVTSFNLLGGESLLGWSTVDVLRGPQSALYGGEAIGGVVSLETRLGSAEGRQSLWAEGGSFGSLRSAGQFEGEWDGLRWFVGGGHEGTGNDRAGNRFEQQVGALRIEQDVGAATIVGMTARGWRSVFDNPGSTGPFATPAEDEREAWLLTGYVEHTVSARLRSKLVAGYYREDFEEAGIFPFASKAEKLSADLRNVVRWNDCHETVVGGLLEWVSFASSATSISEEAWQSGLYLNHVWKAGEDWTWTAGGRWEHYEEWDDVLTWRATGSWATPLEGVRLHGSFGTGFRAPSYFELFGELPAFGFKGNPNLKEEHSRGWDAGIEWSAGDSLVVDVTWFHNAIDDLIDFTPANVGDVTTQGIEVEARGSLLAGHLEWRGAYTWLEAEDDDRDRSLVRRPRHAASVDLRVRPGERTVLGAGGTYGSGRLDNDFSTFPAERRNLKDQLVIRAYGRHQLTEHLAVHARVENLLDRDYEEIADFPAAGFGAYGGVELSW